MVTHFGLTCAPAEIAHLRQEAAAIGPFLGLVDSAAGLISLPAGPAHMAGEILHLDGALHLVWEREWTK